MEYPRRGRGAATTHFRIPPRSIHVAAAATRGRPPRSIHVAAAATRLRGRPPRNIHVAAAATRFGGKTSTEYPRRGRGSPRKTSAEYPRHRYQANVDAYVEIGEPDHPQRLMDMTSLARVYNEDVLKQYERGLAILVEAEERYRKALGEWNANTQSCMELLSDQHAGIARVARGEPFEDPDAEDVAPRQSPRNRETVRRPHAKPVLGDADDDDELEDEDGEEDGYVENAFIGEGDDGDY